MRVTNILSLFAICVILQLNAADCLTQNQSELIDYAVEIYRSQNNAPGLALGVVQDGELIIVKGYGKRSIPEDLDIETNTLFPIGSVSKVNYNILRCMIA